MRGAPVSLSPGHPVGPGQDVDVDVQTLHRQPGATPLDAARAAPAAHSPRARPPATLGRKGPQRTRTRTRTRHEVSSRLFTRGLTRHTSPVVPCSRTQQAWSLPGRGPRHGRPPSEARRAGPRTGLFRAVPEQHSCPGARAATTRVPESGWPCSQGRRPGPSPRLTLAGLLWGGVPVDWATWRGRGWGPWVPHTRGPCLSPSPAPA